MARKIPKKFEKAGKSFVGRLEDHIGNKSTAAFCAFPEGVSFNGQDEGEEIILLVRQHPVVFWPQYLLIIFFLISPLLFVRTLTSLGDVNIFLGLGLAVLGILLAITVAVDTFLKWFYSVNIVTDEKIVDVDFSNVLYHKASEAQLEKIEDVSHAPSGILSSIFDFGDVFIQTAGSRPEFDFNRVPKPREIQDTLLDLLEMKQKGTI